MKRTSIRAMPFALACLFGAVAHADTWTLRALEDFPVIDAGEVPYYREPGRDALAIDASILAYRDRFARATTLHPGPGGRFDLVLTTLAEVDGETTYHLLVDGNRVGTATNPRVPEEFSVQEIAFTDIEIPEGAMLGVDSAAVSNGLVPENGEYAYARGRWRSLDVSTAGSSETYPASVDLSLSIMGSIDDVRVGDEFVLDVRILNADGDTVATSPTIDLSLPDTLAFGTGEGCTVAEDVVRCVLPEIAPDSGVAVSLVLTATSAGEDRLLAIVTSDQPDRSSSDNRAERSVAVQRARVAAVDPTEPAAGGDDGSGGDDGRDRAVSSATSGGGGVWSLLVLTALARLSRHGASRHTERRAR